VVFPALWGKKKKGEKKGGGKPRNETSPQIQESKKKGEKHEPDVADSISPRGGGKKGKPAHPSAWKKKRFATEGKGRKEGP